MYDHDIHRQEGGNGPVGQAWISKWKKKMYTATAVRRLFFFVLKCSYTLVYWEN